MGAKLNEAAGHYSQEGWDRFYLTIAGTDCNVIIDMLSELFGPPFQLEPEELNEPARKKAHTQAAAFEERMLKQEGVPDTSKTKVVYPTSKTISYTIWVPTDYHPTVHQSEEPGKVTGHLVGRTYYHCMVCTHRPQNRDSTYNHTCHHLNVIIGCAWPGCPKMYDAPDGLITHINKKLGGLLLPDALSKTEAEEVIAGLAASTSK